MNCVIQRDALHDSRRTSGQGFQAQENGRFGPWSPSRHWVCSFSSIAASNAGCQSRNSKLLDSDVEYIAAVCHLLGCVHYLPDWFTGTVARADGVSPDQELL